MKLPKRVLAWRPGFHQDRAQLVFGLPVSVRGTPKALAAFVAALRKGTYISEYHADLPDALASFGLFPATDSPLTGREEIVDRDFIVGGELAFAPVREGEPHPHETERTPEYRYRPMAAMDAMHFSQHEATNWFESFSFASIQDLEGDYGTEMASLAGLERFDVRPAVATTHLLAGAREARLLFGTLVPKEGAPEPPEGYTTFTLGSGIFGEVKAEGLFVGIEIARSSPGQAPVEVVSRELTQRDGTEEEWKIIEARDKRLEELGQHRLFPQSHLLIAF